jgi:hypothetical protein
MARHRRQDSIVRHSGAPLNMGPDKSKLSSFQRTFG